MPEVTIEKSFNTQQTGYILRVVKTDDNAEVVLTNKKF